MMSFVENVEIENVTWRTESEIIKSDDIPRSRNVTSPSERLIDERELGCKSTVAMFSTGISWELDRTASSHCGRRLRRRIKEHGRTHKNIARRGEGDRNDFRGDGRSHIWFRMLLVYRSGFSAIEGSQVRGFGV